MEEKYLDISIIESQLKLYGKMFTKGAFWTLELMFAVILALCSLGSITSFLWGLIAIVVVDGMFVCVYWVQHRKLKAIENNDFCLVEDVCVNKKFTEGDINADSRYTLYFKKFGRYVEHHGNHYSKISIGDTCYILLLGGSRKVYWVSNKYAWQGLVGFEKRGNAYYPQRDR